MEWVAENIHRLVFYALTAMTLGSGLVVVLSRKIVYAAFSLFITFLGLAGLYASLGADFLAITQIAIYAGGILVLLLFGVMFTQNISIQPLRAEIMQFWPSLIIMGIGGAGLIALIRLAAFPQTTPGAPPPTVAPIGESLLTVYLLPFELASVLLVVALIGAVIVARARPKEDQHGDAE